jgi:hypothetical protein
MHVIRNTYLENLERRRIETLSLLHDFSLGSVEDVVLDLVDGQHVFCDLKKIR